MASPTVPGAQEQVERVVVRGGCEFLRKKFPREYRAAERVTNAWAVVYGQAGNAMDFDRARGSGAPGSMHPKQLNAAHDLREVVRCLYPLQANVVLLVAGAMMTVDQASELIYGRVPSRTMREEIGRQLRYGLGRLAEQWWGLTGAHKPTEVPHAWRAPNLEVIVKAGTVQPGEVIHASENTLKRSS